jgi:hypothetical protein
VLFWLQFNQGTAAVKREFPKNAQHFLAGIERKLALKVMAARGITLAPGANCCMTG